MLVFSLTYLVGKIVSDPIRLLEGQVYVFCSATTLPKFVTGVPSRLGRHQASRRKVFQICKRGSRHGVVDRVTKKPNMNVSPWPRGVPDSGFSSAHTLDQIAQVTISLRSPCPISSTSSPKTL